LTTTIGAVLAFAGIYLILAQGPFQFGWLHLWGLASGISASLAMMFLNLSRRHHDTETILFYLFGVGSILTYAAFSQKMIRQAHRQNRDQIDALHIREFQRSAQFTPESGL
jgi:drug/metabolite transporter (DMT)-like permease